ncbi:MAG: hypothetical protein ACI84K_001029 [Pseudohongiellaceae bacterium]|jgi:hypothetical protein
MLFSKSKLFIFLALTGYISGSCWAEEVPTEKTQCKMYGAYQNEAGEWLTCEYEQADAEENEIDDYQYTDEPDEVDEYQHTEQTEQDSESEEQDEQTNDSEY